MFVTPVSALDFTATAPPSAIRAGDYFSTDRNLYRVQEVHGEFALIEDCRRDLVLQVALDEILTMNRVRRGVAPA